MCRLDHFFPNKQNKKQSRIRQETQQLWGSEAEHGDTKWEEKRKLWVFWGGWLHECWNVSLSATCGKDLLWTPFAYMRASCSIKHSREPQEEPLKNKQLHATSASPRGGACVSLNLWHLWGPPLPGNAISALMQRHCCIACLFANKDPPWGGELPPVSGEQDPSRCREDPLQRAQLFLRRRTKDAVLNHRGRSCQITEQANKIVLFCPSIDTHPDDEGVCLGGKGKALWRNPEALNRPTHTPGVLVWEKDANNSRGNCALHNKRLFSDKVGSTLEQCHLFKDKHRDYAAFSTLVHRALCLWDGVCTEKTALIWINLRNLTFFPPQGPAEINASRSWVSNVCLTFFSSMCPFTTKDHNPEVEYSSTSSCHLMWKLLRLSSTYLFQHPAVECVFSFFFLLWWIMEAGRSPCFSVIV